MCSTQASSSSAPKVGPAASGSTAGQDLGCLRACGACTRAAALVEAASTTGAADYAPGGARPPAGCARASVLEQLRPAPTPTS
jgi:hypothetical protein